MEELTLARFHRFIRRGEGACPILGQIHKLTGPQARAWYQLAAGIYPTQAYLKRIGTEVSDLCPFCLEERKTQGHFTNRCQAFHDTRTKSHNKAWQDTAAALLTHLTDTTKWYIIFLAFISPTKWYMDTPMAKTPLTLATVKGRGPDGSRRGSQTWTAEKLQRLQPDAVTVDTTRKEIRVLEFTRPSDTQPQALETAAIAKADKYHVLMSALRQYARAGWSVEFYPLPVGVRGSLLFKHWIPMLEALHIPVAKHTSILQQTTLASAKAFHLLHVCRHKNKKTPATTSLQSKRREYAKEAWGKAPPPCINTAKAT